MSALKPFRAASCGCQSDQKKQKRKINLSCASLEEYPSLHRELDIFTERLASKWRRDDAADGRRSLLDPKERNRIALSRKCLFRSGDSNRENKCEVSAEKICETNSGGHTSAAPPSSGSHASRTKADAATSSPL